MATIHYDINKGALRLLKGAKLSVLVCLLGHTNIRNRCWPKVSTICHETDLETATVCKALKELQEQDAIRLVAYSERCAEEKTLHRRRHVYQITGAMKCLGVVYPYLFSNTETNGDLGTEEKVKVSESEISESETHNYIHKRTTSKTTDTKSNDFVSVHTPDLNEESEVNQEQPIDSTEPTPSEPLAQNETIDTPQDTPVDTSPATDTTPDTQDTTSHDTVTPNAVGISRAQCKRGVKVWYTRQGVMTAAVIVGKPKKRVPIQYINGDGQVHLGNVDIASLMHRDSANELIDSQELFSKIETGEHKAVGIKSDPRYILIEQAIVKLFFGGVSTKQNGYLIGIAVDTIYKNFELATDMHIQKFYDFWKTKGIDLPKRDIASHFAEWYNDQKRKQKAPIQGANCNGQSGHKGTTSVYHTLPDQDSGNLASHNLKGASRDTSNDTSSQNE